MPEWRVRMQTERAACRNALLLCFGKDRRLRGGLFDRHRGKGDGSSVGHRGQTSILFRLRRSGSDPIEALCLLREAQVVQVGGDILEGLAQFGFIVGVEEMG